MPLLSKIGVVSKKGFSSSGVPPNAPTIGTATATGVATATVNFTSTTSNGGSPILSYSVTTTPAGGTGTVYQSGSGTISVTLLRKINHKKPKEHPI